MRRALFGRTVWRAVALLVLTAALVGATDQSVSAVRNMATGAKAYQATVSSNSAVIVATYSVTYRQPAGSMTVTTSGPFSWSHDEGELTVSTVATGRTVGTGMVITTQEIIDGNHTYSATSTADAPPDLTSIGGWTETTWRGRSAGNALELLDLGIFGLGAPSAMPSPKTTLGLLRSKATSDKKLGTAVLEDVKTTRFRSLIPFSQLGVPGKDTAQIERVAGTRFLQVDYWTDSTDRLRLMQFGLTLRRPPSETTTTTRPGLVASATLFPLRVEVQLQVSDYGTSVSVAPPPASEITSRTSCVASANGFSC
jgi:hypothetical protein